MASLRMTMRIAVVLVMALQCLAAPAPAPGIDSRPDIIEIIAPAQAAQETLDSLNLGEPNSEQSERNKRTIGILRQLFPTLSQIIDQKIQQIVSVLFRTVGRSLLSGALGGGAGARGGTGATSSSSGNKISISLPTYGPDTDDDDDSSEEEDSQPANSAAIDSRFNADVKEASTTSTTQSTADNEVQASTPAASSVISSTSDTLSPEPVPPTSSITSQTSSKELVSSATESLNEQTTAETDPLTEALPSAFTEAPTSDSVLAETTSFLPSSDKETDSSTVSASLSTDNESDRPSGTALPATSAVNGEENLLSEAESQQSEVRVQFADPEGAKKPEDVSDDQDIAASGGNGAALDDLSLDDADSDSSDENRNKRFLNFGFGGDSGSSGSGGSGGGSGNFLFDIIRRPAENMARAAGQAFRVLTGTDSIGLGITASHTASRDLSATKLVAGSGGTEQSDEAHSAPLDGDVGKGDGYTEGIPGPVTRLFIIANRGISNLIQDLILRLAQTSERIVNFKARLITSII